MYQEGSSWVVNDVFDLKLDKGEHVIGQIYW